MSERSPGRLAGSNRRGLSRTAARMSAEGATWLATGVLVPDASDPADRMLDRLDAVVPLTEQWQWLTTPNETLGGRTPRELIETDDLEPLQAALEAMPELPEQENGRAGGGSR